MYCNASRYAESCTMATFQVAHRCPHCRELSDFVMTNFSEVVHKEENGNPPLWELGRDIRNNTNTRVPATHVAQICALSRCPRCQHPTMFVIEVPSNVYLTNLERRNEERIFLSYRVVTTYPQPRNYEAHASWPEKIRKPFTEAQQFLDEQRTPSTIITICRSVVDVAAKELGGEGATIFTRIEDLYNKKLIAKPVADWAHEVRTRGADAVHDLDGGTIEQAKELVEFIKLFLHVTFELSEDIKRRQIRSNNK